MVDCALSYRNDICSACKRCAHVSYATTILLNRYKHRQIRYITANRMLDLWVTMHVFAHAIQTQYTKYEISEIKVQESLGDRNRTRTERKKSHEKKRNKNWSQCVTIFLGEAVNLSVCGKRMAFRMKFYVKIAWRHFCVVLFESVE